MVKNLKVYTHNSISKNTIHRLLYFLKKELEFRVISLEISFVNSSQIIQLNKKHLDHNYSTDVITFNYSKSKLMLEGEILISSEDALKNAKRFRSSYKEEIYRLIIHGVLHLVGYNDEKTNERKLMKIKEDLLLKQFVLCD